MHEVFWFIVAGAVGAALALFFLYLVGMPPKVIEKNMEKVSGTGLLILLVVIVATTVIGCHFAVGLFPRSAVAMVVNAEVWLGVGALVALRLSSQKKYLTQ